MKTAAAIRDQCEVESTRTMAEMMVRQLIEIMPELKEVSGWHAVGQRRSLDELGKIVDNRLPDDVLQQSSFWND